MLDAAPKTSKAQLLGRILLGIMLVSSVVSNFTYLREPFQAQVPPWVPLNPDLVVVLSGCVEIVLGLSLMALYRRKAYVGIIPALFFVAVFPGNIAQYTEHRAALYLFTGLKPNRDRPSGRVQRKSWTFSQIPCRMLFVSQEPESTPSRSRTHGGVEAYATGARSGSPTGRAIRR